MPRAFQPSKRAEHNTREGCPSEAAQNIREGRPNDVKASDDTHPPVSDKVSVDSAVKQTHPDPGKDVTISPDEPNKDEPNKNEPNKDEPNKDGVSRIDQKQPDLSHVTHSASPPGQSADPLPVKSQSSDRTPMNANLHLKN